MAQRKKTQKNKQKNTKRISRSQRIMVIIGVFVILAMMLPALLSIFQ